MTRTTATILVSIAGSLAATATAAQVIDFESVPFALDDMKLTNQFKQSHGIEFGIDNNHDLIADNGLAPRLERVGPGPSGSDGFWSSWNGNNDAQRTDRPERLGGWFLRSTTVSGAVNTPGSLLIDYTSGGTYAASGQIWDIDGDGHNRLERWTISAFDRNGSVISQINTPLGRTSNASNIYESGAFTWSFNLPTSGPAIDKIRIDFSGTLHGNVTAGLVFDNFSAYGVPAPGGAAALLSCGLFAVRRRRG